MTSSSRADGWRRSVTLRLAVGGLGVLAAACGDDAQSGDGGAGGGSVVATGGAGPTSGSASQSGQGSQGSTTTLASTGPGGGVEEDGPIGLAFESTPLEGPPIEVPLIELPAGATELASESFIVHTCVGPDCFDGGADLVHLAVADEAGNFLYEPLLDPALGPDPAAEVNTYHHLSRFLARFRELGFGGFPAPAHILVDAWIDFDGDGEPDDFFAGTTDVFGRPGLLLGTVGDRRLAYDPDVFGHELTHLVTATMGALALETSLDATGISVAAGALREGTADVFAASFTDDPDIGEYSVEPLGLPYFTSLANDASCPLGLLGEAHYDGQVWSGALWDVRGVVGADRLERALFDALGELPLGASLPEAWETLRSNLEPGAAEGERGALDTIAERRGMPACSSLVPLDLGSAAVLYLPSRFEEVWDAGHAAILPFDAMPAPLQLQLEVPAGVTAIEIRVAPYSDEPLDVQEVEIHVRLGQPVEHTHDGREHAVQSDASAVETLVLDATSEPPLAPGLVFISLQHAGVEDAMAVVSAVVLDP